LIQGPIRAATAATAAAVLLLVLSAGGGAARADDPAFLSLGAGAFDVNLQDDTAAEFRVEYRSAKKVWIFKPFGAVAVTSDASLFIHSGVLVDIFFGRRVVLTGSFGPGFYVQGGSDKDLGHPLEFRSQAEIAWRFNDRSRLGLAISHYSNAGLGNENRGAETAMLYYSIPVDKVWKW